MDHLALARYGLAGRAAGDSDNTGTSLIRKATVGQVPSVPTNQPAALTASFLARSPTASRPFPPLVPRFHVAQKVAVMA